MASPVGEKDDQEYLERSAKRERDILKLTGSNGIWQFRVFLVLFSISIPGAGQNLAVSFTAPDIDYWCARPPEASTMKTEVWKREGLPPNDKQCSRYANLTFPLNGNRTNISSPVVSCEEWEYDHTFYASTLLEEFDLVCKNGWLISLSKSVFMAGILVSVIFGSIADKVGRRPTIAGCCLISFISSGICAFSTSFTMFLVFRFFVAVGVGGYFNNLYVLMTEIVGPELRSAYGNMVQLGWSVGFVCLPGVVWLIRDWFWIQIALTASYSVFLAVWWMIPESPRWLLSKGKTEKAKEMLIQAAKMNGRYTDKSLDIHKTLEEITSDNSENIESEERNGTMLDLLITPGLWQITLNIMFSWSVISFIYYGLIFNTNDLVGDPFINFAASGVVEFPANGFSILIIRYFGRRKSIAGTMISGGLICLLSYFVPKDPSWLRATLPVIGKFFITSCYGIVCLFTVEVFPTVVRSSGIAMALLFEQLGSILAPFVRELGKATQPFVPFIVYGILACTSGLLTLLLPETANKKMPDTIKEATAARKCPATPVDEQNGNTDVI